MPGRLPAIAAGQVLEASTNASIPAQIGVAEEVPPIVAHPPWLDM